MPVSIRFYRDVPGFEVVATSPILGEDRFHRALLRLGNAGPAPDRVAGRDDTGLFFACHDVDLAYEELRGIVSPPRIGELVPLL